MSEAVALFTGLVLGGLVGGGIATVVNVATLRSLRRAIEEQDRALRLLHYGRKEP